MNKTKLIAREKEDYFLNPIERLYKGTCVKIKNSPKTFQVVGINPENMICWIREWPFHSEAKKTFALEISQITLQIFCPNKFSE